MKLTMLFFIVMGCRTTSIICVRCRVNFSKNFGLDRRSIKENTHWEVISREPCI